MKSNEMPRKCPVTGQDMHNRYRFQVASIRPVTTKKKTVKPAAQQNNRFVFLAPGAMPNSAECGNVDNFWNIY